MTKAKPAVIVHGGAGPIRDDSLPQRLDGCKVAALAAWKILEHSGSALDAAEAAVVVLEDNPLFNAGTGSTLNGLGKVEMDAGIMDGDSLRAGAVAALEGIKNPIKLARRVLEDGRHVILAAEGALMFAREIGFVRNVLQNRSLSSMRESAGAKNTAQSGAWFWTATGRLRWRLPPAEFSTSFQVGSATRPCQAAEHTQTIAAESRAQDWAKRLFALF